MGAIAEHGSLNFNKAKIAEHVWANYCSHQRLFTDLDSSKGADYVVVFEDDIVVSSALFEWLQFFIHDAPPDRFLKWDALQIDPFGDADHLPYEKPLKRYFRNYIASFYLPWQHPNWGFHALLVRRTSLHKLVYC